MSQDSEELAEHVEQAIMAKLGEQGHMLTGYLAVVVYIDNKGDKLVQFLKMTDSSATENVGLSRGLNIYYEKRALDTWFEPE